MKSLDFARNAYSRDKKHGFVRIADKAYHSSSVVDVFTDLLETHNVLDGLNCEDSESICVRYYDQYTTLLIAVLTAYCELVMNEIYETASGESSLPMVSDYTYCTSSIQFKVFSLCVLHNE